MKSYLLFSDHPSSDREHRAGIDANHAISGGEYIPQPLHHYCLPITMTSKFECLFRHQISLRSMANENAVKCVTVNRNGSDGIPFLQVRLFNHGQSYYKATMVGICLSSRQVSMLMELSENHLMIYDADSRNEYLAPEGLHSLTGDAWIGLTNKGKEVMLMRKNNEGLKGVTLSVYEYCRLRECFPAISHIIFPTPGPKDVEITEALGYEIRQILSTMRFEKCNGCDMDLGNQLGHECVTMAEETFILSYYKEAMTRVDIPRLLRHVEYLHELLKCGNPLPTVNEVMKYFKDCEWYVQYSKKRSSFELLLTSFDGLQE